MERKQYILPLLELVMILQITETLAPVIESAKRETSEFTLLFMLLVLIAVCVALVKLYNDSKTDRKMFVEQVSTTLSNLSSSINTLSSNVAGNTAEAKENRILLEKINDLIRDRVV